MSTRRQLFAQARERLAAGQLTTADLDRLEALPPGGQQHLLYLYALQPSVRSPVVSGSQHRPDGSGLCQIDPLAPEVPYETVLAAMRDGWRVISFPLHREGPAGGDIELLGYLFVLEQML
ncbi:MAG: hypothetical protein KF760_05980 [Candidatus Eremiobacteraeota bacterium]|nr:hypothetical protein [Candidatus Eremiobacteraeota bacterium]MCW5867057.1 hypothetical protein [Candidatus Eremiobacteraeota bacterium]